MKRLSATIGSVTALSAAVGATCAVIATWRGRQRWISVEPLFDDDQPDEMSAWEPRQGDRRPGFRASTALDGGMCTGFAPPGLTVLN